MDVLRIYVSKVFNSDGLETENALLNNISKMLERLILKRIQSHVISSSNFNPFQLAYRRYFSAESALLLAVDNIYHAIDRGSSTVLVLLDLSAAFDTIEHSVLNRLENSFGNTGLALARFQCYLSDRRQFVRIGGSKYPETLCLVCAWSNAF